MPQTIEFHNTPSFTREFVNNWLTHVKKHKDSPAHVAVLEDVVKLIDVALTVLQPGPADPENKKQSQYQKRYGKRITDHPDRKGF